MPAQALQHLAQSPALSFLPEVPHSLSSPTTLPPTPSPPLPLKPVCFGATFQPHPNSNPFVDRGAPSTFLNLKYQKAQTTPLPTTTRKKKELSPRPRVGVARGGQKALHRCRLGFASRQHPVFPDFLKFFPFIRAFAPSL